MIELDDNNFDSILSTIFREKKTAVIFYGQPNCAACHETFANYNTVKDKVELTNNIHFYYVDFTKCWIPENRYYELQYFDYYPKVLIFKGSFDNVDFREGAFKIQDFNNILNGDYKTINRNLI